MKTLELRDDEIEIIRSALGQMINEDIKSFNRSEDSLEELIYFADSVYLLNKIDDISGGLEVE